MSINLHDWGSQEPIQFKLTLNGVGVEPALQAGDIKLLKDGVFEANIGALVTPVTGAGLTGVYVWTPAAGQDQCKIITINIKDLDGPGVFDENTLIISTGGDPLARHNG